MIDAHIHADTRPYEDFEKMAVAGINAAVTCAHDPLPMITSAVILDHFYRLLNNDVKRAAENNLKLYVALGIHPRSISTDFEIVLDALPSLLENDLSVAIGEIGLETASKSEKNIFKRQLLLAESLDMKVVVHTPRQNKSDITAITLSILEENIDPSLVLIDHVDRTIIDEVLDSGAGLGLTVQPLKMTPLEAVSVVEDYGFERFLLDSDMSSSPSDPLSVPKTVHQMRFRGFKEKGVKKVSYGNAADFFGI